MTNFKKSMRLFALVIYLCLALTGIGIAGAIPVPSFKRKENENRITVEQLDPKANEATELLNES